MPFAPARSSLEFANTHIKFSVRKTNRPFYLCVAIVGTHGILYNSGMSFQELFNYWQVRSMFRYFNKAAANGRGGSRRTITLRREDDFANRFCYALDTLRCTGCQAIRQNRCG